MKPSILEIQTRTLTPEIAVVALHGKLMLGKESAELQTLVPGLLEAGARHLIFDLSGVTHIDSTGIGRFIDAYSRVGKGGGQIKTGRILDYLGKPNRRMCSLYLSLMEKVEVRLKEFGDSKEKLLEV